jgi:hypothetical protein
VKIRLQGKAVQITETEDRVSCLRVISYEVNNCSSAMERPNKQSVKQEFYELLVTSPSQHVTVSLIYTLRSISS